MKFSDNYFQFPRCGYKRDDFHELVAFGADRLFLK